MSSQLAFRKNRVHFINRRSPSWRRPVNYFKRLSGDFPSRSCFGCLPVDKMWQAVTRRCKNLHRSWPVHVIMVGFFHRFSHTDINFANNPEKLRQSYEWFVCRNANIVRCDELAICVLSLHLFKYWHLLYGGVSQGLGTTEFTSLIGWNRYWPRSRFPI